MAWLPYKALNDLICIPLGLPLLPIVEVPWWQGRPLTTAVAVLVVATLAAVLFRALARSRAAWGVLVGILLAQAPTLFSFSASYNYYLATAGWAVLLAMWMRRLWPSRPRLVLAVAGVFGAWYLTGLWAGAWMLHSAARAEKLVRATCSPPNQPTTRGTRLFFINLPFFAAEVGPALRNASGRPDLEVYPLTFAPELFCPAGEVAVEQEGDRTLVLRSQGAAFFSGAFGDQVQLAWFGAGRADLNRGPFALQPAAGSMPFRVDVLEADEQGVRALRFVFDHPLDDPQYRFFSNSPRAFAEELQFHCCRIDDGASCGNDLNGSTEAAVGDARPAEAAWMVQDLNRVRRMQAASGRCLQWLANWPF